jgi:hypothetical protein
VQEAGNVRCIAMVIAENGKFFPGLTVESSAVETVAVNLKGLTTMIPAMLVKTEASCRERVRSGSD